MEEAKVTFTIKDPKNLGYILCLFAGKHELSINDEIMTIMYNKIKGVRSSYTTYRNEDTKKPNQIQLQIMDWMHELDSRSVGGGV